MDRARRARAPSWQSRACLLALVLCLVVWGANGRVKQYRRPAGRSAAPVALLVEKDSRGGTVTEAERAESRKLVLERWSQPAEKSEARCGVIVWGRVGKVDGTASWRWMDSFPRSQRPPPRG